MNPLRIKRVYASPEPADGTRILVDRLWPRGISRDRAAIDLWLKEIAPSDALRKRFHAKPEDWREFCVAYDAELEGNPATHDLIGRIKSEPVTLLYAARNEYQNNAIALNAWLERLHVKTG
jgi:uncharacterized protein YeaO (DUF488 family)